MHTIIQECTYAAVLLQDSLQSISLCSELVNLRRQEVDLLLQLLQRLVVGATVWKWEMGMRSRRALLDGEFAEGW